MEEYFFLILSDAVGKQSRLKCIKYIASGEHSERVRLIHASHQNDSKVDDRATAERKDIQGYEQVVFQVTTPAFYSRFFHYHSPSAALERELLDESNTRTVWSSHPQEIFALFSHGSEGTRHPKDWRWDIISMLRTPPFKTNFPHRVPYELFGGMSQTDHWVLQHCSNHQVRKYQCTLLRLYLGNRIGGFSLGSIKGDLELIGLSRDAMLIVYDAIFKTGIATLAVNLLTSDGVIKDGRLLKLLLCILSIAGLNLWACLKSIF